MEIWFHPAKALKTLTIKAAESAGFDGSFDPVIRPADPKFGDFQSNGALQYAKAHKENPRAVGEKLLAEIKKSPDFDESLIETSIAGPGFINFKLTKKFLGILLHEFQIFL